MSTPTVSSNGRKRHRVPLSCAYCRAKKKKCDKKKPACSYCVEHDNTDNCFYESQPTIPFKLNSNQSAAAFSSDVDMRMSPALSGGSANAGTTHWLTPRHSNAHTSNGLTDSEMLSPPISEDDSLKLNIQLAEMKKQIRVLEFALNRKDNKDFGDSTTATQSPLSRSAKKNAPKGQQHTPVFEEDEFIDLYRSVQGELRSNCIYVLKPLLRLHLFCTDSFYLVCQKFIHFFQKRLKQMLKDNEISHNFSALVNPMAAQLNENFKTTKLSSFSFGAFNKESSRLDINARYVASLCVSKKGSVSGLQFYNDLAHISESSRTVLIGELKRALPKKVAEMKLLWQNFEKYVYPFAPFLDMKSFKCDLELIIVGLKVNWNEGEVPHIEEVAEYEINLTSFIDFTIIATFLIILRLSYLSLKANINFLMSPDLVEQKLVNVDNLNYIGTEFIALAFSCISQSKALTKTSLSLLHTFMYLYYYYAHSEEHVGSFCDNERMNSVGLIFGVAYGINLYRDWSTINFLSTGKIHPGCNYLAQDSIVYTARKSWNTLLSIDTQEFIVTGLPLNRRPNGHNVKLPEIPEGYGIKYGPKFLVDKLIDMNYKRQLETNSLIVKIELLFHNTSVSKTSDVFDCQNAVNNHLLLIYGNAERFFADDSNFEVKINLESSNVYHRTLVKVFYLEQFILLQTANFKLLVILFIYYQEKQESFNYFYFLKMLIRTVVTLTKVYIKDYLIDNEKFLNVAKDMSLKNFNYKVLPVSGKLIADVLFALQSIIFSTFIAIYQTHLRLREGGPQLDVEAASEHLQHLICLKKILIKYMEALIKVHFYKNSLFYFQYVKFSCLFGVTLREFKECDDFSDRGEEMRCFNVLFSFDKNKAENQQGELLGVVYRLEKVPQNPAFCNLGTYEFKQLIDILLQKDLTSAGANVLDIYHGENCLVDNILDIVRNSSLYDTFTDSISFKGCPDQLFNPSSVI